MFQGIRFLSNSSLPSKLKSQVTPVDITEEASTPIQFLTAPSSPPPEEAGESSSSATFSAHNQIPLPHLSDTSSSMSNERRPDFQERGSDIEQLHVVDPEAMPDKPASDFGGKSITNPTPSEGGGKDATKDSKDSGEPIPEELSEEEKKRIADEEERDKVLKRMAQIVDRGLDKVKPLLEMIDQAIDEAEKKKENNELDEDAFVSKMKPLIENAHGTMQSTLDQIKALDPDNKFERLAKRHVEDAQATADEKLLIDGCNELSTRVQATIDKGRKAIEGMPKAKKELGPLFSLLSEPLLQILGAVGLLVAGVLNLLANILNALGLGGALTQVLQGLRITNLLESMGYSVNSSKKK
ncbi:hypothetical protein ABW19_dt0208908 [Dactylella cylindrospora]|nr:hypothetical protein ABW19_dt0208908 [Dactylella cylindrospora]